MNRPDTVHVQLQRLLQQGLSIDDACSALRNLGYTDKEVRPLHQGVLRSKDVGLLHGAPRRLVSGPAVERRSARVYRVPFPEMRQPSRWDKLISLGSWLTVEAGAFALMILGTAHIAASFQSPLSLWIAISGAVVTTVALIRMRRGR